MRVLSLCSGIGGLDLGIKLAVPEARVVAYVEKDDYCQQVLRARMADGWLDEAPIYEDLTTFDGTEWRGRVDLICGGFPCQDISAAGRREGIREGNRSGLWFEFARVIREVGPRYVFVENVRALLVRGMDIVLGDLADLGLDAEWGVFSAAEVGAPHLRKRVFILAYACRERRQQVARGPSSDEGTNEGRASENGDVAPGLCPDAADAQGVGRKLRSAEGERQGRPAGGDGAMANTAGIRIECLREVCGSAGTGDGEGRLPEPAGGSPSLADTAHLGHERGRTARGGWCGSPHHREPLADGGSARLEGSGRAGATARPVGRGSGAVVAHTARHKWRASGDGEQNAPDGTGDLPLFPPGPADREGWARLLDTHPEAQPAVCRDADGLPKRVDAVGANRVQRLKALGNAVVPLQAAYAFRTLSARIAE